MLFILCKSGNDDLLEYLVGHGLDINKKSKYGETVLFIAYESRNKNLIENLVEHGKL